MATERRNEFTTWPSRFVEAAAAEIGFSIKTVPDAPMLEPNAAKEAVELWRKLYGRTGNRKKEGD